MNRPSCRTFQRKHLRVGSRPWGRRSGRTSPPSQSNTRTRPTPCPRLGSFGNGFFLLQVAKLLIGPITPELCFLLVAFQRSLCLVHGLVGTATQGLSAVRSLSPRRLPVPARAWTSPRQACRSSRASCCWLPSACAFSFLSATATQDHSLQDLLDSCATSGASVFCWRHPRRAA